MLRVIGGEFRGRSLDAVRGFGTRPLLGQVREAVFNILGQDFSDLEVWDLFAGTGASGIEALSRGARRVLFLEKSNQALSVLRRNLDKLGPDAKRRSHVLRMDAWDPPPLVPEGEPAEVAPDVVFLDPPYAQVLDDPVRAAFRARQLVDRLAPDGVLCFHFQEGQLDVDDFDPELGVDLRVWGSTAMAFIRAGPGPRRRR
jgi:16S rRNA (guanine966-N2)-methyltransferase